MSWIVQHVVHDVLRSRCGTPIELLLPQRRLATDLASEEEADEGGAENHEERVLTQLDRRNQHVLPLMRGGSPHNFLYLLRGRFSLTTFRKQFHCGPERVHQSQGEEPPPQRTAPPSFFFLFPFPCPARHPRGIARAS